MTKTQAIKHFGTQVALAKALDLQQSTIAGWKEEPPLHQQIRIEVVTGGALKADLTDEERQILADRRRRREPAQA
jgi:hypothetical protein